LLIERSLLLPRTGSQRFRRFNQPALAFSTPAVTGENEDGLLTLSNIMKLKLNADWVVLSANILTGRSACF